MKRKRTNLAAQMKKHVSTTDVSDAHVFEPYEGDFEIPIYTGSTLLDLAISGTRVKYGGLPLGIIVEVFGASGSGKTVLLTEIAGAMQRKDSEIMFFDPEARLNKQFAKLFDFDVNAIHYYQPDTVTEVFDLMHKFVNKGDNLKGVFTDSLAALSTDLEMDAKEGDKMGMRRAKEFSEQLRKAARVIAKNKVLFVASNQIRDNVGVTWGSKTTTPGGHAFPFYASLRIHVEPLKKLTKVVQIGKKEIKKVIGVRSNFKIVKSSIDIPFREAPVTILFDYGIDDIRENLQFIKDIRGDSFYSLHGEKLAGSMEHSIIKIEKQNLEQELREEVAAYWLEFENKARSKRARKRREW